MTDESRKIPEVGKTYNMFDDGKIKDSRREVVVIDEIIPFDKSGGYEMEIDSVYYGEEKSTLLDIFRKTILCEEEWGRNLINRTTDAFVVAHYVDGSPYKKKFAFSRSNDGWYTLDGWDYPNGRLDVSGELTAQLDEQNRIWNEKTS